MSSGAAVSVARPHASRLSHVPALDGLRGIAVAAVLLYHGRVGGVTGGFLGVTSFFVLSGFLITGLLLAEREGTGRIDLREFWVRRARRLAPGILVLLALVAAFLRWSGRRASEGVLGDAIAALTWVSNWRFVAQDQSYAALFSAPTPFQHMWSLAVEEQFYVLFPLAAMLLLGRSGPVRRGRFAAVVVAALVASTALAALLHPAGSPPGRSYYGTDTRIAEPLVGVLLAVLLVGAGGRVVLGVARRRVLDVAAAVSAAGLAWMMVAVTEQSDVLHRGGLLAAALLTAVIVAAATQPGTVTARVLSWRPLTALGLVSYGVYLFHWPIFLWLTASRTGLTSWSLFALRSGATLVLAVASYAIVEQPIRLGRVPGRIAAVAWAPAGAALLVAVSLVVPATVGAQVQVGPVAALEPAPGSSTLTAAAAGPGAAAGATAAAAGTVPPGGPRAGTGPRTSPTSSGTAKPTTKATAPKKTAPQAPKGLFTEEPKPAPPPPPVTPDAQKVRVAVIGDSMADSLAIGLERWARTRSDVVVYNLTVHGCPMSTGGGTRRLPDDTDFGMVAECTWWRDPAGERATKLAQFDPDIVLVQDGMNEVFDRKLPDWRDYRRPGQVTFDDWLQRQYRDLVDTIATDGTKLLLANAACADWELMGTSLAEFGETGEGDRRVRSLNLVTQRVTGSKVSGVDLQGHLCPRGRFTQEIDGVSNARPDGYHLTDDAATKVAEVWLGPIVLDAAGG